MNLQIIKSQTGQPEYVLLPIALYNNIKPLIEKAMHSENDEYEAFQAEDYVDNPVALARIKAHITQAELAKKLRVTQAYISKIENQDTVSSKVFQKMNTAIKEIMPKK